MLPRPTTAPPSARKATAFLGLLLSSALVLPGALSATAASPATCMGNGCNLPYQESLEADMVSAVMTDGCYLAPVGSWAVAAPTLGHAAVAPGASEVDLRPLGRADGTWVVAFILQTGDACTDKLLLRLSLSDGGSCATPEMGVLLEDSLAQTMSVTWLINAHAECEALLVLPSAPGVEAPRVIYLPPQIPPSTGTGFLDHARVFL